LLVNEGCCNIVVLVNAFCLLLANYAIGISWWCSGSRGIKIISCNKQS